MMSGGQSASVSPAARTIRPLSERDVRAQRAGGHADVERLFRLLVGNQFDCPDQADAAGFADQRMIAQLSQALLKMRRDRANMVEDSPLLIDFQRLDPDRGGDRMPGIGKAVSEDADFLALAHQRIIDSAGNYRRRHRLIARCELLGHYHHVGLHVEKFVTEHGAEPAEAADHLVGNEQHVVLLEHRLDLVEVGARRHQHAARPHHRLGDESGDRVRPLLLDQGIELFRQP